MGTYHEIGPVPRRAALQQKALGQTSKWLVKKFYKQNRTALSLEATFSGQMGLTTSMRAPLLAH